VKQTRIHATLTITWCSLVVPTLLWWRQSILWVAFMSLYANIVGHWSSWEGARAAEKVEQHNDDR
jgi:hypothetical protein